MKDQPRGFVVFGATGSIGRSLVDTLAHRGHRVLAVGRDSQKLLKLANESGCKTASIDLSEPETFARAFESADAMGLVDGVINCIGSVLLKPAHSTTDAEWDSILHTNLTSCFLILRQAAKTMRKNGGSIVFVSSAAARIGIANHEAIAAAKAGVVGLTRSAAATYAGRNIRVNAVAPGLVKSEMTRKLWESESAERTSAAMHPLGRIGDPADLASTIAWLLSPEARWITGQVIGVDGGLGSALVRPRTP